MGKAKKVAKSEQRAHVLSLTNGQRYVLKELETAFANSEDEDYRIKITLIRKAFRLPVTPVVNRELNSLRGNGIVGEPLVEELTRIYHVHQVGGLVGEMPS